MTALASLEIPGSPGSCAESESRPRSGLACSLLAPVAAILGALALPLCAAEAGIPSYEMGPELPSLPGEERANPRGAVNVDGANITIRDRAAHNTLGVRLDSFRAVRPSVALENGWLLRNDVGVGGAYMFRNDYSDVLFNGVYAPRRDVRVQVSVSQLRSGEGFATPLSRDLITVLQTGYVASIRKLWDKSRFLPEAAAAVFTARAADPDKQDLATHRLEMGTLGGYMLNVSARPSYHSRLELGYKSQGVAYDHPLVEQLRQKQSLRSIDYARVFEDCSRINGRYSTGAGANQINLQFERRGFNVAMQQTRTGHHTDNAIRVGYSRPLGGTVPRSPSCSGKPIAPTSLQALVDSTITRSPYLPDQPLARLAALKTAGLP